MLPMIRVDMYEEADEQASQGWILKELPDELKHFFCEETRMAMTPNYKELQADRLPAAALVVAEEDWTLRGQDDHMKTTL